MDSLSEQKAPAIGASPNLPAIEAAWKTLATGGVEASLDQLLALCHDDVELRPYFGGGRVLRGREAAHRFFRESREAGMSVEARPRSFAVEGDSVVVTGGIRVTRADDSFAETQVRWVHHFRGDRIDAISWEPRSGGSRRDTPAPQRGVSDKQRDAQAVIDALNARDFDALRELPFDDEMEYRSAFAVAEGGTYRGVEGLRRWAADVDATWDRLRTELAEFHDVDDEHAVAIIRLTGIARASGIPLDVRVGQVWTWREGRMLRNVVYTDPNDAFRAVGLQP
jgi:ketosteroid isomerase-like protein